MWATALPFEAIAKSAGNPRILQRLESLFVELAEEIDRFSPTCWNRGGCCHFGKYGHQLFVTPLELSWFLARMNVDWLHPNGEESCPYKLAGACGVRAARPLGCRVFYCQEGTEAWQQDVTERYLAKLRTMHGETDVPYAYCEWLSALRQITQHSHLFIGLLGQNPIQVCEMTQPDARKMPETLISIPVTGVFGGGFPDIQPNGRF